MAVDGASAQQLDRDELRRGLVTSSTKRRIHELSGLQHQVEGDCASPTPRANAMMQVLIVCSPRAARPAHPSRAPVRDISPL